MLFVSSVYVTHILVSVTSGYVVLDLFACYKYVCNKQITSPCFKDCYV